MATEAEIKKYLLENPQGLGVAGDIVGMTPFAEDESQEIQGPTPELPFRYTQQELSEGREAVTGQASRAPRARSAYMGMPQGISGTFYQNRLPIMGGEIATGKLPEGYADSMWGRYLAAQDPNYEGAKETTGLFDINAIAKDMGISDERLAQLVKGSSGVEAGYTLRGTKPAYDEDYQYSPNAQAAIKSGAVTPGGFLTPAEMKELSKSQNIDAGEFQSTSRYGADLRQMGKIKDKEKMLLGLMQLSGRMKGLDIDYTGNQKQLDLDLNDPRHMQALMNMALGGGGRFQLGGAQQGFSTGQGLRQTQREIDRNFRRAGRISGNEGLMGNIVKGVILATMAAVTGGALAPALLGAAGIVGSAGSGALLTSGSLGASLATGAAGGMIGGATMTGLQGLTGSDVDLRSALTNIGLGTAGGGLMGGLMHGIGNLSAGQGLFEPQVGSSAQISAAGQRAGVSNVNTVQDLGKIPGTGWVMTEGGKAWGIVGDEILNLGNQTGTLGAGVGAVGAQGTEAGQMGIASSPTGGSDMARRLGTAAIQGGAQGAGQTMQQASGMEAGLAEAQQMGLQAGRQAQAARMGGGIFASRLPDNPYYDPNQYNNLEGVQEGIL